jgi:phospholipid/cholesterol/gamma-HCH transport system permease protein
MASAAIETGERDGVTRVSLSGDWTLASLPTPIAGLEARLADLAVGNPAWNLVGIERIDSVGAILLWRAWGRRWPQTLELAPQQRRVIERVAAQPADTAIVVPRAYDAWIIGLGILALKAVKNLREIVTLIGQMVLDVFYLFRNPREFPLREFSATLYKSGAQALPVTALVGFLIGIVLSYLSSLQLKTFGADIFIVNLIGISVIRELGPVIVAMRVTEEIDALATMGISRSIRLVLPKVAALSLAMPLLVIWCSAAGIVGGMVSANLEMGLAYGYFIETLPRAVPVANLWIAIGKGFFFGMLIALIACHFGLKVRPNTESLSSRTTSSVVTAITVVIIVDAVFAILTRSIGMPAV